MNGFTDKQWKEFTHAVSNAAKLGTLEAIAVQKKDCREEFVQAKECQTKRERCQKEVHRRIDGTHKRMNKITKRPHMYELERASLKEEPDATITFNLSNHFRAYWFRYALGVMALVILTMLGYNVMGN